MGWQTGAQVDRLEGGAHLPRKFAHGGDGAAGAQLAAVVEAPAHRRAPAQQRAGVVVAGGDDERGAVCGGAAAAVATGASGAARESAAVEARGSGARASTAVSLNCVPVSVTMPCLLELAPFSRVCLRQPLRIADALAYCAAMASWMGAHC